MGNKVYIFLRDKLDLPINRQKSGIRRPVNFELLGYGFAATYKKGEKGKYQAVVKKSSWGNLKRKLKQITRKTLPWSLAERIKRLNEVTRGWINNFRLGSIYTKLKKLDEWVTACGTASGTTGTSSLEEVGAQTQKPHQTRHRTRNGIRMESNSKGRLGSSPKSNFAYYYH